MQPSPFPRGAEEIVTWRRADVSRQQINPEFNALCDRILSAYQKAWPENPDGSMIQRSGIGWNKTLYRMSNLFKNPFITFLYRHLGASALYCADEACF